MVLSLDELATATGSSKLEILELFNGRNVVDCFIHQCGLDRELQKHWKSTQSIEYKFNCRILDEPTKYPDPGPVKGAGSDIIEIIAPDFVLERCQIRKEEAIGRKSPVFYEEDENKK
ncbi:hypothetical protein QYM36_018300 [Artemia franciscana]|uniref:Uncharacterized protein n=1 Tax=Artemia franciscana TaxID=6661 RepID=A0AA88H4L2_ARTSF|nr:hypothetical protein QYM36_018300 [Artemia franciscana]